MSVTIGTQLGSHEITALLGKGGMGEVYRARDTKLKREVAIKILPEEFSSDPDRVARFQREAEVLASLNHPNIAAIFDLSEVEGSSFLRQLLERIPRLDYVAALIGLQTEDLPAPCSQYDRDSIQFESQILATCIAFDRLLRKGVSPQAATTILAKRSDNAIAESLGRLPSAVLPYEATCLPVDRLSLQMILDQDVRTTKGVLLVAKGAEVRCFRHQMLLSRPRRRVLSRECVCRI